MLFIIYGHDGKECNKTKIEQKTKKSNDEEQW